MEYWHYSAFQPAKPEMFHYNLQTYEKKWNPMSSFSKKMVKNVFNDEVFNLVFVYFFFSVVCECV